jgi:exodeoxyribonuclease VII large subunit
MSVAGNPLEPQTAKRYLTVSEVHRLLNEALEVTVPALAFEAEISTVSRPASGHVYLKLKDEQSQISGVMWRGSAQTLSFDLVQGLKVLCFGRPVIYAARGELQVTITKMVPAGEGALQKRFLELKAKLEREGLFAPERKRPIPFLPRAIGVVTSHTGAVIRDIMVKLKERAPQIPVFLVPCKVQGMEAAQEICAAIDLLNATELVDVIIVARGGGSLEDLWSFNEEIVVRSIFRSKLPVISGVGHEVDITLADLVADVRAPTPTAAAEMVVPKCKDLEARLLDFELRLQQTDRWLLPFAQRLDDLDIRFGSAVARVFDRARLQIETLDVRLQRVNPARLFHQALGRVDLFAEKFKQRIEQLLYANTVAIDRIAERFTRNSTHQLDVLRHQLSQATTRLETSNPTLVLNRGFSIVSGPHGIVRSGDEITPGDTIDLRFANGGASATVKTIKE